MLRSHSTIHIHICRRASQQLHSHLGAKAQCHRLSMHLTLNKGLRFLHFNILKYQHIRCYCHKVEDNTEIPTNTLREYYSANDQSTNGFIYDKKPFRYTCKAGKVYTWCLCGRSHKQPFCDGTHRNQFLSIRQKPIRFSVKETKDYWLCNCKQTSNRPFCDGTHLREDIQAIKY